MPLCLGTSGIRPSNQITIVCQVRETGPDLLSVQDKIIPLFERPCLQTRQIRTRAWLAHANTEDDVASDNFRQKGGFLLWRTVAQDGRSHLSVAKPMRCHWSAIAEQLLCEDETVEIALPLATVRTRPGQANPAAPGKLLGKRAVETDDPGILRYSRGLGESLVQKGANLLAERFLFRVKRKSIMPPYQVMTMRSPTRVRTCSIARPCAQATSNSSLLLIRHIKACGAASA